MRGDAPLDLTLTKKAELVRDVKACGSFGCSNRQIVEFRFIKGRTKTKKPRVTVLASWHSGEMLGCSETC